MKRKLKEIDLSGANPIKFLTPVGGAKLFKKMIQHVVKTRCLNI